jgi:hypothetical protein
MPNQRLRRALLCVCGARGAGSASVLLIAALGLLGGPCAMAFALLSSTHVEPAAHQEPQPGAHEGCPNAGGERAMSDDDCCCVLLAAGGGPETQSKPPAAVWAELPAAPIAVPLPEPVRALALPVQRACLHETSPPVYLATSRLRI